MREDCGMSVVRYLGSGGGQQRLEATCFVQSGQIVESTDVSLTNIDLRYGTALRLRHHFLAPGGIKIDSNLVNFGNALRLKESLCH